MKPKGKVKITWSPELAYAVGLIATDGCLLNDGRHIDFTSKDIVQIKNFKKCLGITNKIGKKYGSFGRKYYPRVQFGDVRFYQFLLDIGLSPAKSKTLGGLYVPDKYFFDFLRGCHDGDGAFYSYYDPRWRSSFMFYLVFVSQSRDHIDWLRRTLKRLLGVKGHVNYGGRNTPQLKYAKRESLRIIKKMYYRKSVVCLKRKQLKIQRALAIVDIKL